MPKSTGTRSKRPRQDDEKPTLIKRRQVPGKTIESRENQLIRLSYDLAEKRILNGSAKSTEVVHFLKLGSTLAQLEKAKLEQENLLLKAKTEQVESQKRVEELYAKAMTAFKTYSGQEVIDEDND